MAKQVMIACEMKRVFPIPLETGVLRVLLVLLVGGPMWAASIVVWLDHGFYRGDARNWYALIFLVTVSVLLWWVPQRMRAATFRVGPDGVLRAVTSGIFRSHKRDFDLNSVAAILLRKRTSYGFKFDYQLAVMTKDGNQTDLWTSGYSIPDLARTAASGRAFAEATGVQFKLVARDINAPEDRELQIPAPPPPKRVAAGVTVAFLPWLAGFIAPQLTRSVPLLVVIGVAVIVALAATIFGSGKPERLRVMSSLFLSAVYYLVAASISYHGLH